MLILLSLVSVSSYAKLVLYLLCTYAVGRIFAVVLSEEEK